jgi:hypothetical protein
MPALVGAHSLFMDWQFDSPSTNTTLLLRFGEAVKSVEARFGSRFPPEAVTIKSDPKTDRQLLGAHPEIKSE